MKPKATLRSFLAIASSSLLAMPSAHAATITWDGDTSTNWSDAGNWDVALANTSDLVFSGTTNQTNTNNTALTDILSLSLNNAGWNITLGTLSIGSGGIAANGTSTLGGTLTLGAAQSWTNSTGLLTVTGTVANGGNLLTIGGAGNTDIQSVISGAGGHTKNGAGILTLSGVNSYAGTTTIDVGTLKLGAAGDATNSALGTIAAGTSVTATGGALDLNGITLSTAEALSLIGTGVGSTGALTNSGVAASYSGIVTIGTGGATIGGSGNITLSAALAANANQLNKVGLGTLTLQAASTRTGATVIDGGNVRLENAAAFGGTTANITINSGKLELGTATTVANGGTITLNNGGTILNGLAGGTARIDKVIAVQNSASAVVTFDSGTNAANVLIINGGGNSRLTTGNASAKLQIKGSGVVRVGEVGQGRTATVAGDWYLQGGQFAVRADGSLGATANDIYFEGGTLSNGGTAVTLGASRVLNFNHASGGTVDTTSGNFTLGTSGQLVGANQLTKAGANSLFVTAANTGFSGNVLINAGLMAFVNNGLGTAGTITFGGTSTLRWGTGNTQDVSSRLVMGNTFTSTIDTQGNNVDFASAIGSSTTGLLTKIGAGSLTLSGASSNTYSGLTTIAGGSGTLLLAKTGSAQAIAGGGLTIGAADDTAATVQYTGASSDMMGTGLVTINGRGILDFNGKTDTIGNVAIVSTGATTTNPTPIINTAGGGNLTIGTLGITPVALLTTVIDAGTGGTITLGGDVTFTAATTGKAQITGTELALGATRTFTVGLGTGASEDLLISAAVTGSTFGLTKAGAGRLALSGTNTYTGATAVNAGTLLVNSPGSLAAGSAVTVASGATLGGTGTIGGTVNISAGGILSPGASIGTLTLTDASASALTLNGATGGKGNLLYELPSSGLVSDLVAITGGLQLNGTNIVSLSAPGGAAAGIFTLMSYTAFGGSGSVVFANGLTTMGGHTLAVSGTDVKLTVAAGGLNSSVWKGTVDGNWDTSTNNWTRNTVASQAYVDNDFVTFDDTATVFTVANTGTMSPGLVTVNNSTNAYIINANIGGTGALIKNGTSTLTLGGTSTYSGGTIINSGNLTIAANANLGDAASNLVFNGTSTLTGGVTLARNVVVNSGGVLSLASTTTGISSSYNLTGTGTVTIGPNAAHTFAGTGNTFTGTITNNSGIQAQALTVGSLGDGGQYFLGSLTNYGAGTLTFTGGAAATTFNTRQFMLGGTSSNGSGKIVNNNTNAAHTVSINTDLGFSVAGVKHLVLGGTNTGVNRFDGDITDNGASAVRLTKEDGGRWALSGTNTYSGKTIVAPPNSGTLILQGKQAVSPNTTFETKQNSGSTGKLAFLDDSAGLINLGNSWTFVAENRDNNTANTHIFVGNNHTANGGNNAGSTQTDSTIALGGFTSAPSSAVAPSQETINITGANGYKLQLASLAFPDLTSKAAATTYTMTMNPTTAPLIVAGGVTPFASTNLNSTPVLNLDGDATGNEIQGAIADPSNVGTSNPLRLTKTNTSTWTLSGTNTYSGTTVITGGTLIGTNAVQSFGTNLSGISLNGSGTLSLRNDSSVSFTNGTSAYNIANSATGATINVDRVTGTGSNVITVGNLTTTSTSAVWGLNFTGANGVSLSAGALSTPVSTAGSQVHTITNNIATTNGASLTLASVFNQATTVASPDLAFTGTGNTIVTGAITQTLADMDLIKNGAGTLTLNGTANTYTGKTTITAGVLEAAGLANGSSNSSIGASTNVAANLVFGAPTATLRYTGASDVTINRGFTTSSGAGGGATIESSGVGTLSFDNTIAIAYSTGSQTRTLTLGGTNTGNNTFGKVIANNTSATSIVKSGVGKWVLDQANTYTGTTVVNEGTLQFAKMTSLNNNVDTNWTAAKINVKSAATLAVNVDSAGTNGFTDLKLNTLLTNISVANTAAEGLQAGAILGFDTSTATSGTFTQGNLIADSTGSGAFHGAIGVTKLGSGTLILDKTNTYTGATTVSIGKLLINGSTAAASAVSVASGAALGGDGTVGGSATFDNGSIFAWNISVTTPANTGSATVADTLAVTGNLVDGGAVGSSVFKIVLAGTQTFTDNFWTANQSWSNVLTSGNSLALETLFTSFSYENANGPTAAPSVGSFSLSGSTLNYTFSAIPEPTSALAGLILGAGLLRRRRK